MSDNMMPELTLNPTEAAQEAVPELTLTPDAPEPEQEQKKEVEPVKVCLLYTSYVTICCSMGCTLYADAALTQPIDDTVSIDTNGEEMTVYVLPDVPLD